MYSYGGERLFQPSDLSRATLERIEGQATPIEIVRDGQPITLYLPRGSIGIATGVAPSESGG